MLPCAYSARFWFGNSDAWSDSPPKNKARIRKKNGTLAKPIRYSDVCALERGSTNRGSSHTEMNTEIVDTVLKMRQNMLMPGCKQTQQAIMIQIDMVWPAYDKTCCDKNAVACKKQLI